MLKNTKWYVWGLVAFAAVLIVGVLLVRNSGAPASAVPPPDYWPTQGWKESTPEQQGLDSARLAEGLLDIRQKNLPIHSLLLIRDGRVVLDAYFYPHAPDTLHTMRSCTKSVTTTLIAMAADQGKLSLDDRMDTYFPEFPATYPDPRREAVTIRNLAMMANGLESMGSAQDEGTLNQMVASDDWMKFAVDRKMAVDPGKVFVYDSPGMHILSGILTKATGMTESEYAQQVLFGPLGITDFVWPADPQGYTHGWGDLHLHPRDAAKIGFLWLHGGMWEGRQLVPVDWVRETSHTQIQTGEDDTYTYGWWYSEDSNTVMAQGRGGQDIRIEPNYNAVIVMTGAGIDYDNISPYLLAAITNAGNPLPPNPDGVARLNAALAQLQQAPEPQVVAALPAVAKQVSGRVFKMDPNPIGLQTVRLTFVDASTARLQATFDNDEPMDELIGLDGTFRFFPDDYDLPAAGRGHWSDDHTFIWERERVSAGEAYYYRIGFAGNRLTIEGTERSHEGIQSFTGTLAAP